MARSGVVHDALRCNLKSVKDFEGLVNVGLVDDALSQLQRTLTERMRRENTSIVVLG